MRAYIFASRKLTNERNKLAKTSHCQRDVYRWDGNDAEICSDRI